MLQNTQGIWQLTSNREGLSKSGLYILTKMDVEWITN